MIRVVLDYQILKTKRLNGPVDFMSHHILKHMIVRRKFSYRDIKPATSRVFLFTIIVKGSDILGGCGLFAILTLLSLHTFQVLSILRDLLIVLKSGGG